jgi:hypothetical protein
MRGDTGKPARDWLDLLPRDSWPEPWRSMGDGELKAQRVGRRALGRMTWHGYWMSSRKSDGIKVIVALAALGLVVAVVLGAIR